MDSMEAATGIEPDEIEELRKDIEESTRLSYFGNLVLVIFKPSLFISSDLLGI